MQFIAVGLKDLVFQLQVLGHYGQLVLVVLLQGVQVAVSQVCQLDLHGLVLLVVALLLGVQHTLQVLDLQPQVLTLVLAFLPQLVHLSVESRDFCCSGFVELHEFVVF